MSVLLETSKGDIVIDLFVDKAPQICFNFLKLCQTKFYNDALFTFKQKDFICKVEKLDPLATRAKPVHQTIWAMSDPTKSPFLEDEVWPRRFDERGLVATANEGPNLNTSSFFITLQPDGTEIKEFKNKHTIFGQVVEGLDVLEAINEVHTIGKDRPL